jgi:hypothetical protein
LGILSYFDKKVVLPLVQYPVRAGAKKLFTRGVDTKQGQFILICPDAQFQIRGGIRPASKDQMIGR